MIFPNFSLLISQKVVTVRTQLIDLSKPKTLHWEITKKCSLYFAAQGPFKCSLQNEITKKCDWLYLVWVVFPVLPSVDDQHGTSSTQ